MVDEMRGVQFVCRVGNNWFRQPLSEIFFAANARGLKMIDAKTAYDGDKKCLG